MALSTNVQVGDPNHHALHNAERTAINASVKDDDARLTDDRDPTAHGNAAHTATYVDAAGAAAAAPVQVVAYGTDVNTVRPAGATVVYWMGDAGADDPVNGVDGDLVFVPDV